MTLSMSLTGSPRPGCRCARAPASCCSTPKAACGSGGAAPSGRATPQAYVDGHIWQLPQGGICKGERRSRAAFRELREETGVSSATLIAEFPGWLSYELPSDLMGVALKGKYAGQKLRWFAMRFEGSDDEIDIAAKGA